MSQSTVNTNLSACFDDYQLEDYYDEFFKQIPLNIPLLTLQPPPNDQLITAMKIKWLIDHFVRLVRYKSHLQKMIQPITDISHNTNNTKKIINHLCNLKVMLKHCDIHEIAPLMTETIFALVCPSQPNSEDPK